MDITTKILQKLGINPHENLTHKLSKLFEKAQIQITESMNYVYMHAAIGILSQISQVQSNQNQQIINDIMSLQKVMCLVNQQQKQLYLNLISDILPQQENYTRWVSEKVNVVRKVYTFHKKYKQLCRIINNKTSYSQQFMDTVYLFIWAIYLCCKQIIIKFYPQIFQKQLIYQIIIVVMVQYLQIFQQTQIAQINQGIIQRQQQQNYFQEIRNLCQTYLSKQFDNISNYTEIFTKQQQQVKSILLKIIDKMKENYYKSFFLLQKDKRVDQMIFQKVDNCVNPYSFLNKNLSNSSKQILTKQEQKTSYKLIKNSLPTQQKYKQVHKNYVNNINGNKKPQSSRLKVLCWVQNCISQINEQNMKLFQLNFNIYNKTTSFLSFKDKITKYIENIIIEFTPNCRKKNKRKDNIFLFYVYFILQLLSMYESKQIELIFRQQKSLISILCLISQLFNFCYLAHQGNYRDYINIFQLDQFYGFRPINWIGRFINLPDVVSDHLYQIQRRFVVKQIWQDQTGYNIITNTRDSIPINEMAIFKQYHKQSSKLNQITEQQTKYITWYFPQFQTNLNFQKIIVLIRLLFVVQQHVLVLISYKRI